MMKNTVKSTVFSIEIYKGKFNSKWSFYTKFSKTELMGELQKIKARWVLRKTHQNQNKNQSLCS